MIANGSYYSGGNHRGIGSGRYGNRLPQRVQTRGIPGGAIGKKVERHNNFAARMPVVEEQIKAMDHRVNDLEKGGC